MKKNILTIFILLIIILFFIFFKNSHYTIFNGNSTTSNLSTSYNYSNTFSTAIEPYIPDNTIKNSSINTINYNYVNNGHIIDYNQVSLSIKPNTLSRYGATLVITDTSENKNSFNKWYRIDKKENTEWIELETLNSNVNIYEENSFFTDSNGILEFKMDWSNLYGELKNGIYRIVKENNLTVEFEITNQI